MRHWVVSRVTDTAVHAAPRLSARAVDRIGHIIASGGRALPVISHNVARNLRSAGLYSAVTHRAYFDQLGQHFAGALHALRLADHTRAGTMGEELCHIVNERIEIDESVEMLKSAAGTGRGVILIGPHIMNYLLGLARLNQEIPLTIYLRYSKEARRRTAKQRWYRASNVEWISEPAEAGGAFGRVGHMAAALRRGATLFITPDLPRKRDDGTPVRLFNREVYLPAGPALLAARSGAPMFMLTASAIEGRQRLGVRGPYHGTDDARGRDARRASLQRRMQWFADEFGRFVRAQPALWYLWGDKRWSRVFQGDARYTRAWAEASADRKG